MHALVSSKSESMSLHAWFLISSRNLAMCEGWIGLTKVTLVLVFRVGRGGGKHMPKVPQSRLQATALRSKTVPVVSCTQEELTLTNPPPGAGMCRTSSTLLLPAGSGCL